MQAQEHEYEYVANAINRCVCVAVAAIERNDRIFLYLLSNDDHMVVKFKNCDCGKVVE